MVASQDITRTCDHSTELTPGPSGLTVLLLGLPCSSVREAGLEDFPPPTPF